MSQCTKERFLECVKNHKIEVRKDEGVYRHIVMGIPGSGNMRYEIVTYPGCLCYSGDMGSYTFSRLEDMFQFFRRDNLEINSGYWHEKMDAEDRFSKSRRFSETIMIETLKQLLDNHFEFGGNKSDRPAIWADIESQVLCCVDDGEYRLRDAMGSFESHGFNLDDHYELDFQDYTYKFIWCLYAIVYAIQQYDKEKTAKTVKSVAKKTKG